MSDAVDWNEVRDLLNALYAASDRLEILFPGRKFTLDGHLVGSIGEVIAAYMFDLDLAGASTRAHDAVAHDGRRIEIKFTQGSSVAIRHKPDHLIVLHRPKDGSVRIVFNGPGKIAWEAAGKKQKNGQCPITLAKLDKLDSEVDAAVRLPVIRKAPI